MAQGLEDACHGFFDSSVSFQIPKCMCFFLHVNCVCPLICIFAMLSFHSMSESFALKCLIRSLEFSMYTGFLFFNSIVCNVNCWASCAEIYIECHYQQWDCCVCYSFHCFQLNEKRSSKLYSPIFFVYIGFIRINMMVQSWSIHIKLHL